MKIEGDGGMPEGELAAFGPDGPCLRAHLRWSLYPEIELREARKAIVACARGECDTEIERAGTAATVVAVLGLEEFVRARCAANLN